LPGSFAPIYAKFLEVLQPTCMKWLGLISATNADIIQLPAAHGQDEFNTSIMLEKEITPGASQVTQLAVVRGRLCLRGRPVDSKSAKEGPKNFVEWLKEKEMPV